MQVGRGVLRRVDRAFQAFFRRVRDGQKPGFPRFKSRARFNTIEIAEPTAGMVRRSYDGRRAYVRLKGLPTITLRTKRSLPDGTPKNLQVTRRPTGIVVSLTFETEVMPLPDGDPAAGVDMGVTKRLTLSDGSFVDRRAVDHSRENRLRQAVARSKRGSNTKRKRVRSLEIKKLRDAFSDGDAIDWLRVHRVPDHVHFVHEAHIKFFSERDGVEASAVCSTCHGDVGSMEKVRQVRTLKMSDCVDCHRDNGAPTDCTTCHY